MEPLRNVARCLVIDTGIHSQGRTRQQALDFLADNTSLSQANVRAEVDRYIPCPR